MKHILAAVLLVLYGAGAAAAESAADLSRLSLEQLANVDITSVSKRAEPLADAPAAVYVITREEIRRSGATSLPEALRLAPNLEVARVSASQYAISARGFNGTTANKLLVLIDGRSVYTPLYSGVFWDAQDVMLEDVERIEVISGPGGVLWGSNAVNGVINIITRSAKDTRGDLLSLSTGNRESSVAARHGGKLGDDASYRVYARGSSFDDTVRASGASQQDAWDRTQAGFRVDWARAGDRLTLQGDAYNGSLDQPVLPNQTISGANVLGRWNRQLGGGSALQVQAYFDQTHRDYPGTFAETLDTTDIEAQHSFQWGAAHEIVWGGGYRSAHDDVQNSPALAFLPALKTLSIANVFLQDTIALDERLHLTLGGKLENNNYTGLEIPLEARLAYKLSSQGLLWGAVSRAQRTPSRLERDLYVPGTAPFMIAGGPNYVSEKLTAYELGYRLQPSPLATFSVSTYYNVYNELRTIEPIGGGASVFGNEMQGDTYGVEAWGSYKLRDWWNVTLGYNALRKNLQLKPGSGDTTSLAGVNIDPSFQVFARSSMNLPHDVEFDLSLRTIAALPAMGVPQYASLDARVGWELSKGVRLSITGSDLLDARHLEFGTLATGSEIGRAVMVNLRLEN